MPTSTVCIYQRFIVIDDDLINNIVSKFIIKKFSKDTELYVFTDPEVALSFIQEKNNDPIDQLNTLVLLDINMPRMNGWEFLEGLRQTNLNHPTQYSIFMVSSSIDPSDIKKAGDHVMVSGFFSKPLTIESLSKTCQRAEDRLTVVTPAAG